MPAETQAFELAHIPKHLFAARLARGLSQDDIAQRSGLKRQQINYFETGERVPSIQHLLRIARALEVPLQRLIYGSNTTGSTLGDIAIELKSLGLNDLWVGDRVVPGAFRQPEEVVALAISGKNPEARIIEGIPAVLAWNRWHGILLRAFARAAGRGIVYRLAWLADVSLALERTGGFPGGCPGKEDLLGFLKRIKRPPSDGWDDLGRPAEKPPASPLWRRWRISYAGDLDSFRQRAQALVLLAEAEGRKLSTWET
jgi:transcriptional regulator with XRE-family HTH domain